MENTKSNINAKIQKVISEITGVEQNGFNKFQNYKYIKQEDIINAIRPLLVKNGLLVLSEIAEENTSYIAEKESFFCKVKVEYNIIDIDDGAIVTKIYYGHGIDKGDKALYKAITGSEKYFYMKNFLIGAPNDDPEYDGGNSGNYAKPNKNALITKKQNTNQNHNNSSNNSNYNSSNYNNNSSNNSNYNNNSNHNHNSNYNSNSNTQYNGNVNTHENDIEQNKTADTISKPLQKALFDSAKWNEDVMRNAMSKFNYEATSDIRLCDYKDILNDILKQIKALRI